MSAPKQPKVWILLADGEHARVVEPVAREGQFHTVLTLAGPGTQAQHGGASRGTPQAAAKKHYAETIAHELDRHAQAHAYDQLVVVAPPAALHDLREALGKPASSRLVGSVNKDLVKLNDHDVSPHLASWWLAPA